LRGHRIGQVVVGVSDAATATSHKYDILSIVLPLPDLFFEHVLEYMEDHLIPSFPQIVEQRYESFVALDGNKGFPRR
jgi:hypothetical protein